MYQINFSPTTTPINVQAESCSTGDLNSIILEAYQDIQEVEDILIDNMVTHINVRVILRQKYLNKLLAELVSRQLKIYERSNNYLFNFEYVNKKFYEPRDSEYSILRPYASSESTSKSS